MSEPTPALEIRGLTVAYGAADPVVRAVDLTVARGEAIALVGESGSGKSTILKAVLGMLPPGARVTGQILVEGVEVLGRDEREIRRLRGEVLGYVSQDPFGAMDPLLSVGANVAQSWRIKGRRASAGLIAEQLAEVRIRDAATRMRQRPFTWSGGMLQRGAVVSARALAPAVVLADEPTSALDRANAVQVMQTLTAGDGALVVVSHDVDLVRGYVDRVYRIVEGQIVCDDAPAAAGGGPTGGGPAGPVIGGPQAPALGRDQRQPVLVARGLTRRYATGGGLAPLDLEVRPGQILGVCGSSGAGKSTLLRLLAGVEEPTAGELRWRDAPGPPPPGQVGIVFQNAVGSLNPRWPIHRSITEPLAPKLRGGISRARGIELAGAALRRVGLAEIEPTRRPGGLSGGQAQRVAIARALIGDVGLLLADEPTAALDRASADLVLELLRGLADDGLPIVIVSHDETRLRRYADVVVELVETGESAADGGPGPSA